MVNHVKTCELLWFLFMQDVEGQKQNNTKQLGGITS